MDPATAFLLGGTALNMIGGFQADMAEAKLQYQNAQWLQQQANFIRESTEREAQIFQRESDLLIGQQIGAFATSGVEMSGSAVDTLNSTYSAIQAELDAIASNGQMQMTEAMLKSNQAKSQADLLSSFEYQAMRLGGTALTSYGTHLGRKANA